MKVMDSLLRRMYREKISAYAYSDCRDSLKLFISKKTQCVIITREVNWWLKLPELQSKALVFKNRMQDKAIQTKEIWKSWVFKSKYFHFYNYLTMDYLPLEPVQSIKYITTKIQNKRQFWNIHLKWSWIHSYHSSRESIKLGVMSSSL